MSGPSQERRDMKMIHVTQGEYAVTGDPSVVMTTVLGSCVATAMYDPKAKLGGLNHFLLPGKTADESGDDYQGIHIMELLINEMLKRGASKKRMSAKLFGGAQIVKGLSEVGLRNADFARNFLAREGIPCTAQSLGGTQARRIRYWPTTDRAQQLIVTDRNIIPPVQPKVLPVPDNDDVELF